MKPFAWACAGVVTAASVFTSFAATAQVVRVVDELRPYGPVYRDSYAAVPVRRPPPPDADLMAPRELIDLLRADGYSPLGPAMRRGWVYTIAVLDQNGDDGRLIVDARTGEPIRFIPAMRVDTRLNEELDSMYGPPGPPPAAFAPDSYGRRNPPPPRPPVPPIARVPAPHPPAAIAKQPAHSPVKSAGIDPKGTATPRPADPAAPPAQPNVDAAAPMAPSKPGVKPEAATTAQASAAAPASTAKADGAAKPASAQPAEVELKPTQPMPPMQTME